MVLLVLGSLSNVVGYQTVQSSNQSVIKERINLKELLFQTIVDIANDKEIQRIILKSQISRGIFPTSEFPVVTKNQIRQMYFLGLILSKVISRTRMQSMIQQHQLLNPITQEGIQGVIEKDVTLRNEITQLQNPECDCENENTTGLWHFPVLCTILFSMAGITGFLSLLFGLFFDFYYIANFFYFLWEIALTIAVTVGCYYL